MRSGNQGPLELGGARGATRAAEHRSAAPVAESRARADRESDQIRRRENDSEVVGLEDLVF